MNTCPSPEAKRQPHIRDIKYALGVFYTLVSFIMRKLGLENTPNVSAPIKTSQQGFYNIAPDVLHPKDFLKKIKLSPLRPVIVNSVPAGPQPRRPPHPCLPVSWSPAQRLPHATLSGTPASPRSQGPEALELALCLTARERFSA